MSRWMAAVLVLALGSTPALHADGGSRAAWTAVGAGGGFGIGVWAGLTAFDDAINSDRKVWTSAIVGAGAGAVAGYLIGRARDDRPRPSIRRTAMAEPRPLDARTIEQLASLVRLGSGNTRRP